MRSLFETLFESKKETSLEKEIELARHTHFVALLHQVIDQDKVSKEDLDKINEYIASGANLAVINQEYTAIEKAAVLKKWEIVELIATLKKTDLEDNYRYRSALELAILDDREYTALILIMAGADLQKNYLGIYSILHLAIDAVFPLVVEKMIQMNPNFLNHGSLSVNPPLAYAAQLAVKATKSYKQACWDIVQFMIPLTIKAVEKQGWPLFWQSNYGFQQTLYYAAKAGNIQVLCNLQNAGVLFLGVRRMEASILDKAKKNNHFPLAAYSLYHSPNLEVKNLWRERLGLQVNTASEKALIDAGKLWATNFRLFLKISTLLVEAFLSPDSIFSQCPNELFPQFFLILLFSMQEELHLNFKDEISQNKFNVHLKAEQLANTFASIKLEPTIKAIIQSYEDEFIYFGLSTAPEELNRFINTLKKIPYRSIQNYINSYSRNPTIKAFLIKNHWPISESVISQKHAPMQEIQSHSLG